MRLILGNHHCHCPKGNEEGNLSKMEGEKADFSIALSEMPNTFV